MMNFVYYNGFPTYFEYRNKQFEAVYSPGQRGNFIKHDWWWRSTLACDRNCSFKRIRFLHKKHFYKRIQNEKRLEGLSNIFFKHNNGYLPGVIYRLHYTTLGDYSPE